MPSCSLLARRSRISQPAYSFIHVFVAYVPFVDMPRGNYPFLVRMAVWLWPLHSYRCRWIQCARMTRSLRSCTPHTEKIVESISWWRCVVLFIDSLFFCFIYFLFLPVQNWNDSKRASTLTHSHTRNNGTEWYFTENILVRANLFALYFSLRFCVFLSTKTNSIWDD